MTKNTRPPGDRLLPWAEVDRQVPYCRQHISRLEREGRFPRRIRVGGNRVAWWESEVEEWKAALPRRDADDVGIATNARPRPSATDRPTHLAARPKAGSGPTAASSPLAGSAPHATAPPDQPTADEAPSVVPVAPGPRRLSVGGSE
jgi:prophage regulatory protein